MRFLRKDFICRNLIDDQRIDANRCVVVGNTKFDLSLFEKANLDISFNPKDEDIKKVADLMFDKKDLYKILPRLKDKYMKCEFSLKYKSSNRAKVIMRSVSPDNYNLPTGLSLKTWSKGKTVCVKIICIKGFTTLLATLNDLFACIQVAEETIDAVEFI